MVFDFATDFSDAAGTIAGGNGGNWKPGDVPPLKFKGRHGAVMARIQELINALAASADGLTIDEMRKDLCCDARTIKRYLKTIEEELNLYITKDREPTTKQLRYRIDDTSTVPLFRISDSELLALLFARTAFRAHKGTPFAEQINSLYAKLSRSSPFAGAPNKEHAENVISADLLGAMEVKPDVFNTVLNATYEQVELRFSYESPETVSTAVRTVQPLHIKNRDGRWYLLAIDTERAEDDNVRNFAIARIKNPEKGNEFTPPEPYNHEWTQQYFDKAFGVFVGDNAEECEVRIALDAPTYARAKERLWHKNQRFIDAAEGGAGGTGGGEFRVSGLRVGALDEVAMWVLARRGGAVAIAPPELKAKVLACAQKIAAVHGAAVHGAGGG